MSSIWDPEEQGVKSELTKQMYALAAKTSSKLASRTVVLG